MWITIHVNALSREVWCSTQNAPEPCGSWRGVAGQRRDTNERRERKRWKRKDVKAAENKTDVPCSIRALLTTTSRVHYSTSLCCHVFVFIQRSEEVWQYAIAVLTWPAQNHTVSSFLGNVIAACHRNNVDHNTCKCAICVKWFNGVCLTVCLLVSVSVCSVKTDRIWWNLVEMCAMVQH